MGVLTNLSSACTSDPYIMEDAFYWLYDIAMDFIYYDVWKLNKLGSDVQVLVSYLGMGSSSTTILADSLDDCMEVFNAGGDFSSCSSIFLDVGDALDHYYTEIEASFLDYNDVYDQYVYVTDAAYLDTPTYPTNITEHVKCLGHFTINGQWREFHGVRSSDE